MAKDCEICCEELITPIPCGVCQKEACLTCVMTHLQNSSDEFTCMFCKKRWGYAQWLNMFPKKSITELRDHRKKVVFKREEQLLPETQAEITRDKDLVNEREQINEEIDRLTEKIRKLSNKRDELRLAQTNLGRRLKGKEEVEHYTNPFTRHTVYRAEDSTKIEKIAYTTRCPADDCRGFVEKGKCGICDTLVCEKCYTIIEDNIEDNNSKGKEELNDEISVKDKLKKHKCNKDNIASIKQLKRDTKPCPKCSTPIYKIDGCDQMWCVKCHTAFSWKTGKIELKVHNPHYYQWIREQTGKEPPREPGDCDANNIVNEYQLTYVDRAYSSSVCDTIFEEHRLFVEFCANILPKYQPGHDTDPDNKILRRKYLLNHITEKSFISTLMLRDKKRQMTRDFFLIIDTYRMAGNDIFRAIIDKAKRYCNKHGPKIDAFIIDDDIVEFNIAIPADKKLRICKRIRELFSLKKYINNELYKVSQAYNSSRRIIV